MKKITTESGAVYLYDARKGLLQRLEGPWSPGIDYENRPDGKWHVLTDLYGPFIGESMEARFVDGSYRVTTPVVSVEDVEDE